MSRLPLVDNGSAKVSSGVRRIVVTPRGEIRDVIKAKRCAPAELQTTYQKVCEGDIVLQVSWWPEKEEAFEFQDGKLVPLDLTVPDIEDQVTKLYDQLPDVAVEWLNPVERQPSFLPAGAGWDGVFTIHDLTKRQQAAEFFEGIQPDVLDKLVDAAQVSSRDGLRYDWRKAGPLPDVLNSPRNEHQIPGEPGILVHTMWVLWDRKGVPAAVELEPTSGRLTHADRRIPAQYFNAALVGMPQDVWRAAKVTFGCYSRRNGRESYGVKWELYSSEVDKTSDFGSSRTRNALPR